MKKDNDILRDELRGLVEANPGKWFHVQYNLCFKNGGFVFEGLEVVELNVTSDRTPE